MEGIEQATALLAEEAKKCSGCGFCLNACTSYELSGWEAESPRGRAELSLRLLEGKITPADPGLSTFNRCLQCTRCSQLCPEDIDFQLLSSSTQHIRRELSPEPLSQEQVHTLRALRRLASPWKRRVFTGSLRHFLLPTTSKAKARLPVARQGAKGLYLSCVEQLLYPEWAVAAIKLGSRLGISLSVSPKNSCCGGIFERLAYQSPSAVFHDQVRAAQASSEQACLSELPVDEELIFLDSACYMRLKKKAAGLVLRSLSSLLWKQMHQLRLRPIEGTFYWLQDCVAEDDTWQRLLQLIPGLRLLRSPSAACCGGAGCAAAVDAEIASRLYNLDLPEGCDVLTTSSSCALQIQRHGAPSIKVLHPLQVLLEASDV